MSAVTRAHLRDAVHRETGLPLREVAGLVEAVLEAIAERLVAGEPVKLSGFGTFTVRAKSARTGRNPKTGEAAPIPPRRVVTSRASTVLKLRTVEGPVAPRQARSARGRGTGPVSSRGSCALS